MYHQIMQLVIVGVGYVGLITGLSFAKIGYKVSFIDTDKDKINALNHYRPPFIEPELEDYLLNSKVQQNIQFFDNDSVILA